MPVKLHVNAARPLYDCITPDRVGKGIDENVRSRSARCFDRRIHVCDKIACALRAEGGGYGCQESEKRYCSNRRLQQLRCSFARRRSHRDNDLLRAATEPPRRLWMWDRGLLSSASNWGTRTRPSSQRQRPKRKDDGYNSLCDFLLRVPTKQLIVPVDLWNLVGFRGLRQ
jgi:hypothetical protein